MKSETLTLVLVNLAGIMERADEALLPSVYKEVGEALHTDPTGLGSLTLFRSLVQCSCYPLAAYLAVRHNRAHVIALGAFLWAAATFLVAVSSTFFQVAVARGLNGIGLAIVIPAIQSLVADSTDDSNRGTAFGWLQLTSNFGSIIGGLFATLLASTSVIGIPGWRIAFHLVAIDQGQRNSFWIEVKDLIKESKMVMMIPYQILVCQGISGSFPWFALSFTTMWLELIGFSHKLSAFLMTFFSIATSLGTLFGGKMGDFLSKRLPNSGRIMMSQISSGSAIPLAAVLLLVLPDDPSSGFTHGLILFVMGFFISWNSSATNNPIFAEIVPERSRTSIYALDRSFETVLASFAPPVVGLLAQHVYGYKPIPKGASGSVETETDRENAASLAKALYTAIGFPMAICCFIYSFLYCTYPRDRERARMDALVASEMQQLDTYYDDGLTDEKQAWNVNEFDVEFARGEGIQLDENGQKYLLSSSSD